METATDKASTTSTSQISPERRPKWSKASSQVKSHDRDKYQKNLELEKRKKENWDRLVAKMQENNLSEQDQERIRNDALHQEAKLNREM